MPDPDIKSRLTDMLKILGAAALYALLTYLAHFLVADEDDGMGLTWAAGGLALALLLVSGRRHAWSVFIGSLLLVRVLMDGLPFWAGAGIALSNALAALSGAWLFTRGGKLAPRMGSLHDFARLALLGGCLGGAVSALGGNAALLASGLIGAGSYAGHLLRWWMGDVLGIILLTPLILAWTKQENPRQAISAARASEAFVLLGLTFLIGQVVFLDWLHDSIGAVAQGYWMFLFVAWVAVRLGVRGVTVALLVTAVQSLWGAHYEVGFFGAGHGEAQLANSWLYMIALSIIGMALATYFNESKQVERALNQFKHTLDQTLDGVFMFRESDYRFIYVNEGAAQQVGYTCDELLEMTPLDIKPAYTLERFREIVQPLRDGTQPSLNFETIHRHKDGHDIPVEIFLQFIRQEGAEPRFMAVVRDIAARKNNEAQIMRLGRVYRLLSRVNEAIVRVRNRDELFSSVCNIATESELFRFAWIGMLDEQRSRVIPVAYAGEEECCMAYANIRFDDERTGNGLIGRSVREDTPVICQDIESDPDMASWQGEALKRGYRASAVFPIHEAGVVVGTIAVYVMKTHFFTPDITHLLQELANDVSFALDVLAERNRRELAEDEIRQMNVELEHRVVERTQQLETVNKELEAFSYSVSHDLRTPLRSIDGFSQILLNKYHAQLDAPGKDYLERVRRATQRMGRLIDDMLQLAQVTRSQMKREQIDLSRMAKEVAEELRKAQPGRQARLVLQGGLEVHADTGLMRIVMDNLLGNAWKYTGKKEQADIEFGAHGMDGERVFFVRDNGAGFNMEYAHKLFGAFQRLHGANEYAGTGVGLATVQRIIHRHHGKVWAEAVEGQGATFYFTLPQRERGGAAEHDAAE